ncbi:MAG: DUF6316 family protein [Pseudomonadota bacterium]
MTQLHPNAAALLKRAEGRLITIDGRLSLVLDVDTEAQIARISRRENDQQQVLEFTLAQLAAHLAEDSDPGTVEPVSDFGAEDRVTRRGDQWFFKTRDGREGPFRSETEARAALRSFVSERLQDPSPA